MSAAATAAGYLYASGRLRARSEKGGAEGPARRDGPPPRRMRVAVLPEPQEQEAVPAAPARPAKVPRVEYRTRRWRPDAG